MEAIMAHLVDKKLVERANTVLLMGILWSGLAVCVPRAVLRHRPLVQRLVTRILALRKHHAIGGPGPRSSP
jgi:hypothetical protein